jgi:chromosome segregation ATPase
MKKAKLSNGQMLMFPEDTSDDAIKGLVKKISKKADDVQWDPGHVKALIKELTNAQGEIDIKRAEIDHFGPAIEKQTNQLVKVTEAIKSTVEKVTSKDDSVKDKSVKEFAPVLKNLTGQIMRIAENLPTLSKNTKDLNSSITSQLQRNTDVLNNLVKLQQENNTILKELVEATRSSKQIVRDKDGFITGVKNS